MSIEIIPPEIHFSDSGRYGLDVSMELRDCADAVFRRIVVVLSVAVSRALPGEMDDCPLVSQPE